MALAFAKIAFTPNVRAAQKRMGSHDAYQAAMRARPKPSH